MPTPELRGVSPVDVAEAAALLGDVARAAMLLALFDRSAMTAGELAHVANVTPQTASGHLAKLVDAGLLAVERHGRRRLHRLTGPEAAEAVEALMAVAIDRPGRTPRVPGPRDAALRAARTCYDHLAGRLGVGVADAMLSRGELVPAGGRDLALGRVGTARLLDLGIDMDAVTGQRRAFCRRCQDWTERRPHLAGAVGAAIAERAFAQGWIARLPGTRAVRVTRGGARAFRQAFGIDGLG